MGIRKFKYPFVILFALIFSLGFHFVRLFVPAVAVLPVSPHSCSYCHNNINNALQTLPSRRNLKARVEEDANVPDDYRAQQQPAPFHIFPVYSFQLLCDLRKQHLYYSSLSECSFSDEPLFLKNCTLVI